jgi:Sulfotransferase domain
MSSAVKIAMWSGPRNISTAMMRSFSSRSDCAVTDEPFYGAFLKTSGEPHPVAADIMADMDCNWQSVAHRMRGDVPQGKAVWYQKHMPHHMVGGVDIMDFPDHTHTFLIRDPDLVAASYASKNELHSAQQLGFSRLADYHKRISDYLSCPAPVADSNDILTSPAAVLEKLCLAVGIHWDPAMLSWPLGPHPTDGIWAAHCYNAVDQSTGFGPPTVATKLPADACRISDACRADYEYLAGFRITA